MPSGLPGKARDLVVDVHDGQPEHRGGFEASAIPHFHDEVAAVGETVQVKEPSFASTTSKRGGREWDGRSEARVAPAAIRHAMLTCSPQP